LIASPETPGRLLDALVAIFPEFRGEWETGETPDTFHQVMLGFTQFFGSRARSLSPEDLGRLGDLINKAVAQDGPLENAVATCLLEHLHQIDAWRAMKPHLSDLARRKSRA
jgi:hypothetical protein